MTAYLQQAVIFRMVHNHGFIELILFLSTHFGKHLWSNHMAKHSFICKLNYWTSNLAKYNRENSEKEKHPLVQNRDRFVGRYQHSVIQLRLF